MSTELLNDHFKTLNVSIPLFPDKKEVKFKTIEKFQDYIAKEMDFWESVNSHIFARFRDIKNHIERSINLTDSNFDRAKIELNQAIRLASENRWPIIYSKTSEAKFIKNQIQINKSMGEAAIHYLIHKQFSLPNNNYNYDYFKGYINSYIFEESAKAFNEAAVTQEATLTELHNDYANQLNSLNEEFYHVTTEWKNELSSHKQQVTEWRESFEHETRTELETVLHETRTELKTVSTELEEIKNRYTEQLRLKGPAKYWEDLEDEYKKSGDRWRWWAIGTTIGFVILMTIILLFQPEYKFLNNGIFDFNSLRNALIFTIITSTCVYLITLFVKLSVSSYHLSRDAKERFQMTHVYLSLINESAVNDVERITILQSIFSRADTGLLKGDGGPTMPDNMSYIFNMLKNRT